MEQAGTLAGGASVGASSVQPHAELPPTSDLVPGFMVGEYRIDKKIGEGGMGAVYSATHPMIGKRAAIKVISAALGTEASAVGRFVQEARSVNQIGHPNIVDVFAFGELPDGRNYFVMEYLQGEGLAERIHRNAMPLGEALGILDQVADALEAAHEKQIVHRDLKPDNVYLASVRGGRTMVKLLDFGIAKLSTPDSSGGGSVAKTRTGMMMGTPGYLSPEQARGKNVDHRTDIYALGCMTFEIACGRLPFVADNAMDIVLAHMTEPAPRPSSVWPEIPPPLDELIARMLEKDPNLRPTLADVRAVFANLVTSGLVTPTSGRGFAFGTGINRGTETPALARPTGAALAVGTHPATPAPATIPPAAVEVTPKKKTGLIAGVLAGVVVVGGAVAFVAMKSGSEKPAAAAEQPVAQPPAPPPAPAPAPAPPTAVAPAPVPPTAVEPAPVPPTAATVEAPKATAETKPAETPRTNAKVERAKTGAKAGSKPGSATSATGTNDHSSTSIATPKTDAKKGLDVNKDAPVDPFE